MTLEAELKKTIKKAPASRDAQEQIKEFRAFRDKLAAAGVEIRKERFSISLMERVGFSSL